MLLSYEQVSSCDSDPEQATSSSLIGTTPSPKCALSKGVASEVFVHTCLII